MEFKKLTENEFYEQFNCIKNHFYKNPEDCGFDGCMFETYGQEVDFINNIQRMQQNCKTEAELLSRKQIWTIIEAEGKMYFVSGYHYVNRFGYLLTEEAVPEGIEYEVELDNEIDEPSDPEIGHDEYLNDSQQKKSFDIESGPFDQLGYEQTSEDDE